jgi:hypothetical protein
MEHVSILLYSSYERARLYRKTSRKRVKLAWRPQYSQLSTQIAASTSQVNINGLYSAAADEKNPYLTLEKLFLLPIALLWPLLVRFRLFVSPGQSVSGAPANSSVAMLDSKPKSCFVVGDTYTVTYLKPTDCRTNIELDVCLCDGQGRHRGWMKKQSCAEVDSALATWMSA